MDIRRKLCSAETKRMLVCSWRFQMHYSLWTANQMNDTTVNVQIPSVTPSNTWQLYPCSMHTHERLLTQQTEKESDYFRAASISRTKGMTTWWLCYERKRLRHKVDERLSIHDRRPWPAAFHCQKRLIKVITSIAGDKKLQALFIPGTPLNPAQDDMVILH